MLDVESAQGGMVLSFFTLAIFGGLFTPLPMLPDGIATIGRVLPSSHFASLGRSVVAGQLPDPVDVLVLVAWAVGARRPGRLALPGRRAVRAGLTPMTSPGPGIADGVAAPMLTLPGPGGRRRLRVPFLAATLFFTIAPLLSVLANPPEPAALALLLVGWAIFGAVLVALFRFGPFVRPSAGPWLAVAVVAMTALALAAQVGSARPPARRSTSTPA